VNFTYKTDVLKKKQYGLIAEEVEKINPDFVSYNKEGVVETVSYNQLISPMIKAMQEQQKTISALQSQVEELRKDREAMLSRLEAIEKGEQGLTRK
jgi:flagellar biosynthesis chaperone FliJ